MRTAIACLLALAGTCSLLLGLAGGLHYGWGDAWQAWGPGLLALAAALWLGRRGQNR